MAGQLHCVCALGNVGQGWAGQAGRQGIGVGGEGRCRQQAPENVDQHWGSMVGGLRLSKKQVGLRWQVGNVGWGLGGSQGQAGLRWVGKGRSVNVWRLGREGTTQACRLLGQGCHCTGLPAML